MHHAFMLVNMHHAFMLVNMHHAFMLQVELSVNHHFVGASQSTAVWSDGRIYSASVIMMVKLSGGREQNTLLHLGGGGGQVKFIY